jgi:hypothetical protein
MWQEAGEFCIMRDLITCTHRLVKSRGIRWMGHVACMGDMRNAYRILVGKPEGKIPCRRHRCRWKHITMNLTEIG